MPRVKSKKAYVVTVDMGYGHQRAVYPLGDIADGEIITANNYPGIPARDRRLWESGRSIYEHISRLKHIPLLGDAAFGIMDYMQRIEPFYPKRDLSKPTLQLHQQTSLVKAGLGRDLIERLNKKPLPYIASFPTVAFFAEMHGYKGDIYCICTDTDINRAWAPVNAGKSRINYLVPNRRVKERLKRYGVKEENILVTGFPLPKENLGKDLSTLKANLGCRISNLDPTGLYQRKYGHTLQYYLGEKYCGVKSNRPLSITFAVGGAGAQREIGVTILKSLHEHIDRGHVRLHLVAGIRNDVYRYYEKAVKDLHLNKKHGPSTPFDSLRLGSGQAVHGKPLRAGGHVHIIYAENKTEYFQKFNETLKTTDILWTKPSELSFYAGLGLPIIMAPTVGSQEEFNKNWLLSIGAGFMQEDPQYTNEWLFDWLNSGWLAEAAMNGFLNAPRNGAYHIENVVLHGKRSEVEDIHLL